MKKKNAENEIISLSTTRLRRPSESAAAPEK